MTTYTPKLHIGFMRALHDMCEYDNASFTGTLEYIEEALKEAYVAGVASVKLPDRPTSVEIEAAVNDERLRCERLVAEIAKLPRPYAGPTPPSFNEMFELMKSRLQAAEQMIHDGLTKPAFSSIISPPCPHGSDAT